MQQNYSSISFKDTFTSQSLFLTELILSYAMRIGKVLLAFIKIYLYQNAYFMLSFSNFKNFSMLSSKTKALVIQNMFRGSFLEVRKYDR